MKDRNTWKPRKLEENSVYTSDTLVAPLQKLVIKILTESGRMNGESSVSVTCDAQEKRKPLLVRVMLFHRAKSVWENPVILAAPRNLQASNTFNLPKESTVKLKIQKAK